MDSISILALTVIAAVPALFVAARIFLDPTTGLCLWVLLLPVTKTLAEYVGYPGGAECAGNCNVLQKLTLSDLVLLLTLAGLLNEKRSAGATYDRQGRRILGLFAAFCVASIASASLGETGRESLIELATYFWIYLALVVICQLLSSPDRMRRVLTAWRLAGVIGCVAGGVGTVLMWRGSMDNLLVQGGRVAGLFEGINQLQSFVIAVIPFFCAKLFSRAASRGTRVLYGALVVVGFAGVVGSGSRAGVVFAALSVWLMALLASPRVAAAWTCAAVLFAGSAWHLLGEHLNELPYGIRRSFSYVQEDTFELDELSIGRADQLRTFYTVFAEHPLVGVGPGGFAAWVPRVVPGGKAQEMHNSYLGVLGETGLLGGLIMLGLLADVMVRTLRFFSWAARARDPDALMGARALFVSYASILMYGMLNYGLRQRHFWFVVALAVAVPHVYGQWLARARVGARRPQPLYGVVPCVESQA
jgi:O-antigen ligase